MTRSLITVAFVFLAQVQDSALTAAEWADLRVKVIYDGPGPDPIALNGAALAFCAGMKIPNERMIVGEDGALANFAMIMNMRKSEAKRIHPGLVNPPHKPLVINIQNCAFKPRAAFAQTGRQVIVQNNDPCGHNYKVDPFRNDSFNSLVPIRGRIAITFPDSERSCFTAFSCTIHPWMKGQLIIRDHPYVGISGKDGVLSIEKLPAGKVTFRLAHENMKKAISEGKLDGKPAKWRSGYVELDLKPGLNEHTITLAPALFED